MREIAWLSRLADAIACCEVHRIQHHPERNEAAANDNFFDMAGDFFSNIVPDHQKRVKYKSHQIKTVKAS
jgi:hypothetical protein